MPLTGLPVGTHLAVDGSQLGVAPPHKPPRKQMMRVPKWSVR
jgi:hypothetical protein